MEQHNIKKLVLELSNRQIFSSDIQDIRDLIETEGIRGRTHISRILCDKWNWRQPNGNYRDMACRLMLRRLEDKGLIELPPMLRPARRKGYKKKAQIPIPIDTDILECNLSDIRRIKLKMVRGNKKEPLYNGLIEKYHYLGYHQGSGEQLKYLIYGNDRLLGCIGFGGSAYKVSCRDEYIGWDSRTRKRLLPLVVNNSRFLILPFIRVPNLASYVLGRVIRGLITDWQNYYHHPVVLLETFVERNRFCGTCYKASNWIYLGKTKGRGRNDRYSNTHLPVKDVYVYPLVKNACRQLCT